MTSTYINYKILKQYNNTKNYNVRSCNLLNDEFISWFQKGVNNVGHEQITEKIFINTNTNPYYVSLKEFFDKNYLLTIKFGT